MGNNSIKNETSQNKTNRKKPYTFFFFADL